MRNPVYNPLRAPHSLSLPAPTLAEIPMWNRALAKPAPPAVPGSGEGDATQHAEQSVYVSGPHLCVVQENLIRPLGVFRDDPLGPGSITEVTEESQDMPLIDAEATRLVFSDHFKAYIKTLNKEERGRYKSVLLDLRRLTGLIDPATGKLVTDLLWPLIEDPNILLDTKERLARHLTACANNHGKFHLSLAPELARFLSACLAKRCFGVSGLEYFLSKLEEKQVAFDQLRFDFEAYELHWELVKRLPRTQRNSFLSVANSHFYKFGTRMRFARALYDNGLSQLVATPGSKLNPQAVQLLELATLITMDPWCLEHDLEHALDEYCQQGRVRQSAHTYRMFHVMQNKYRAEIYSDPKLTQALGRILSRTSLDLDVKTVILAAIFTPTTPLDQSTTQDRLRFFGDEILLGVCASHIKQMATRFYWGRSTLTELKEDLFIFARLRQRRSASLPDDLADRYYQFIDNPITYRSCQAYSSETDDQSFDSSVLTNRQRGILFLLNYLFGWPQGRSVAKGILFNLSYQPPEYQEDDPAILLGIILDAVHDFIGLRHAKGACQDLAEDPFLIHYFSSRHYLAHPEEERVGYYTLCVPRMSQQNTYREYRSLIMEFCAQVWAFKHLPGFNPLPGEAERRAVLAFPDNRYKLKPDGIFMGPDGALGLFEAKSFFSKRQYANLVTRLRDNMCVTNKFIGDGLEKPKHGAFMDQFLRYARSLCEPSRLTARLHLRLLTLYALPTDVDEIKNVLREFFAAERRFVADHGANSFHNISAEIFFPSEAQIDDILSRVDISLERFSLTARPG